MKILITGGAGFIGSYLTEELTREGNDVTVLDNFFRGKEGNISSILDRITLIKDNILNKDILNKETKGCDIVYHLAGISQVMESVQKPELCFDYNVKGTFNVINACIKNNSKLIFSSSREVYGDNADIPVSEDSELRHKSIYGFSKSLAESMIWFYGKEFSLDYVIFRIANAIGKRDFGRVVPIFIERCRNNEPLILFGGKQLLDFVYISDVVNALKKAGNVKNETINIGSGKGITIEDLAYKIKKIAKSDSEIIYKKERKEETQKFVANIDKAKKMLGWKPKTGLETAFKKIMR